MVFSVSSNQDAIYLVLERETVTGCRAPPALRPVCRIAKVDFVIAMDRDKW